MCKPRVSRSDGVLPLGRRVLPAGQPRELVQGILYLLWAGDNPAAEVGPESVGRAARLVDYLKDHARRVYGRLRQAPEDRRVSAALDWVRERGGRCTARDLLGASVVTTAVEAKAVLRELEARGYGRLEAKVSGNNKTVESFVFESS